MLRSSTRRRSPVPLFSGDTDSLISAFRFADVAGQVRATAMAGRDSYKARQRSPHHECPCTDVLRRQNRGRLTGWSVKPTVLSLPLDRN